MIRAFREAPKSLTTKWMRARGFTLLEILVALAILATAMMVLTSSFTVNLNYAHRNRNLTVASFLIHGAVYDLERKLLKEPFPENTVEDQDCTLPTEFKKDYKCSYDLVAINLTDDQIMELSQNAMGNLGAFTGQDEGQTGDKKVEKGGKTESKDALELPFGLTDLVGGDQMNAFAGLLGGGQLDISTLMQFAPLLGENGLEMINLCQINIEQALMNMMGFVGFFPQLVKEVIQQTRKLVVRIEWAEGPENKRKLEIETYLISLEGKKKEGWDSGESTDKTPQDKTFNINDDNKKVTP